MTDSIASDGQTPIIGALKVADGSELLPSYTFTTDTSDGFHHPASGQVAVTLGGSDSLIFEEPSATAGAGLIGGDGAVFIPIGMIVDFGGSSAPSGWFLCYGQAVSRTTYASLFTVLGTTWGSGDGSTTFNLPDLRGRTGVGKDNMGGSTAGRITAAVSGITGTTLGATGGEEGHVLITGELAAHTHTGTTGNDSPDHTHIYQAPGIAGGLGVVGGSNAGGNTSTGGASVNHQHAFTTASSGSGTTHNNVQPTAIVNKIIFAGNA